MPILKATFDTLKKLVPALPRRAPSRQDIREATRQEFVRMGNFSNMASALEALDWLDRWDIVRERYFDNSSTTPWFPLGFTPVIPGSRFNRADGRNRYTHWTEQQLLFQRDAARILDANDAIAQGVLLHIENFVVGKGATIVPRAREGIELSEAKLQLVKDRIKAFEDRLCDETGGTILWNEYQREFVRQAVVDGEMNTRVFPLNGGATIRTILPEQITQPPEHTEAQGWHMGVHCQPGDAVRRFGYWVTFEPGKTQRGEYVPAKWNVNYRRNVYGQVVRGVSDFFSVTGSLDDTQTLINAIRVGARVRAKIAYIEQLKDPAPGAVSNFANTMAGSGPESTFVNPLTKQKQTIRRLPEGAVLTVGDNYEAKTLPQGQSIEQIAAAQFSLRMIMCVRWGLPEYMATADASNNNYASIMVAGGPAVRMFERNQGEFGERFKQIIHRVLEVDEAMGYLPVGICDAIDLQVEFPTPVISDPLQQSQVYEIEHRNKVTSTQTWQQVVGRDPKEEQANFEEELKRDPQAQMAALPGIADLMSGQGDQSSRDPRDEPKTSKEGLDELDEVIERMSDEEALEVMQAAGLNDNDSRDLVKKLRSQLA